MDFSGQKIVLTSRVIAFSSTLMSGVIFVAILAVVPYGTIFATNVNFNGFLLVNLTSIIITIFLNGVFVQTFVPSYLLARLPP